MWWINAICHRFTSIGLISPEAIWGLVSSRTAPHLAERGANVTKRRILELQRVSGLNGM